MAKFTGFEPADFDVFSIDGLDERMNSLRGRLSPKLEAIATALQPTASSVTGDEMFVHVAKHARRTKNPPNDTWSALANSKRGYKQLPHFQFGMWGSHVFIWFALIYECPIKAAYANELKKNKKQILDTIPDYFVWSKDHTQPDTISHQDMKNEQFDILVDRLANVKKAEILCGLTLNRDDQRLKNGPGFLKLCDDTVQTLSVLYNLTKNINHG